MYFRLGLKLVRNAIASSSERTYQGHFGAWAEFRLSLGKTVFPRLQRWQFAQCVVFVRVRGICVHDKGVASKDG